ncbi:MAG: CorA family divalent cation transporter, partial [Clostridia bacterium]
MIKLYQTSLNEETKKVDKIEKGVWISLSEPTDDEIKKVCEEVGINDDFIKYALDNEEKARIDVDEDDKTVLFIIDTPIIEEDQKGKIYTTMPMGIIFVRDDYIITVATKENDIIKNLEKESKKIVTYKKSRILLQILYNNSELFLNTLKKVNKESEIAEHILQTS